MTPSPDAGVSIVASVAPNFCPPAPRAVVPPAPSASLFDPRRLDRLRLHGRVRDLAGLPETLGRLGSLELKFAVTKKEIRRAQRLRWKVFYEEGGAAPDRASALRRRDLCPYDRICDHLIVVDHAAVSRLGRIKPRVVGCYRLLRQDVAQAHGGFYSASEFDIAPLLARHPHRRFLELGRSCVAPAWRNKRTLELLWRGVWAYAQHHRMDVLIGCASFAGADATMHAAGLAFLRQNARAPAAWSAQPLPHARAGDAGAHPQAIDARRALAALPPLIKGYLRLGARFGDGAVIDRQFGTTDVFVVTPVEQIDPRYIAYFSGPLEAMAAA